MIYYISNLGDDKNDGLSPETPIATIPRANALMRGGDTLRLKRGDTFYGRINPPAGPDLNHMTTYEPYGDGEKPVLYTAGSEYEEAIITNYDPRKACWQLTLESLLDGDNDTQYELMHEPERPIKTTIKENEGGIVL